MTPRKHGETLVTAVVSATTTTQAVVAAPGAGKRIWVHSYTIVPATTATAQFQSASNSLTGAMAGTASGAIHGKDLICNANEALNLVAGGTGLVAGHVTYSIGVA